MLNTAQKLNPKIFTDSIEKAHTRDGYGEAVTEAGTQNQNIVVLSADLSQSTKSDIFEKKFPTRFIEVGVAEQNMAGIAAGLALNGKIPFMASYACFSPGRNWEQIRVAICISKANVKIISSHGGFSASPDGATHQALEDIALLRVLPNMTVLVPADYTETKKAVEASAKFVGPVYIRLAREVTASFTTPETPFEIGKAQVLMEGSDVTLIACGPILYEALKAAHELESQNNIKCEVVNCSTIKPLDEETILASIKKTKKAVVVEEHQVAGGLGGAICELASEKYPIPVKIMGAKNTFGESGKYAELLDKYEINAKHIMISVINFLKEHKNA